MVAFEVLVITCRMCLDVGMKHIAFARKIAEQAKLIYSNIRPANSEPNVFIYLLNDLEFLKN